MVAENEIERARDRERERHREGRRGRGREGATSARAVVAFDAPRVYRGGPVARPGMSHPVAKPRNPDQPTAPSQTPRPAAQHEILLLRVAFCG